jgi:hypothetical protein
VPASAPPSTTPGPTTTDLPPRRNPGRDTATTLCHQVTRLCLSAALFSLCVGLHLARTRPHRMCPNAQNDCIKAAIPEWSSALFTFSSGLLVIAILNFRNWEPVDSLLTRSELYLEFKIKSVAQAGLDVTLLTCIWEVLGSDLVRDTGYPYCYFSWLSSVDPRIYRDSASIWPRPLPFKFFHIHHASIILPWDTI